MAMSDVGGLAGGRTSRRAGEPECRTTRASGGVMTDQARPTGDGVPATTRAWSFDRPAPAAEGRLALGLGAGRVGLALGDRVGIAWLRRTCGVCRWCRTSRENLCPRSEYTGWDADGGLADHTDVPAAYAYRLPEGPPDEQLAPPLCAGIIGYRALRRGRPAAGR